MAAPQKKSKAHRRLRLNTIVWGAVLTLSVAIVDAVGGLAPIERWAYDRRAISCQLFTPPPTDRLVNLAIDDSALQAIGAWPWPRSTLADMMDEIRLAGPKAVALDVLFTEPQRPEWVQEPDGTFKLIDHDARLAEAFARMGNVLVPASLPVESATVQTPAEREVERLLLADLELTPAEIAGGLKAAGVEGVDYSRLDDLIIPARRTAAMRRVDAFLDGWTPPAAAAAPTSAPASGPATATSATSQPTTNRAAEGVAAAPPFAVVRDRLLPRTGRLLSPLARTVEEAYEQTLGARALRRKGWPIPSGMPMPYHPARGLLPVAELVRPAAATAFVDFPTISELGDGKVRSVPLFVERDGRLFPQIGLMLAAMMLDADPSEFVYGPRAITIPRAGPGGAGLVLPVRTARFASAGVDLPAVFDVPWAGPTDWRRMFPESQQLSFTRVYSIARTRAKIAFNNAQVDRAIFVMLGNTDNDAGDWRFGMDRQREADFFAKRPAMDDVAGRIEIAKYALAKERELDYLAALRENERPNAKEAMQLAELEKAVANLKLALAEAEFLPQQLAQERASLRTVLAGKAVLVGWSATAMVADMKPTSIHAVAPGVMVHGTIVNALLTGQTWRTVPAWATALVTLVLGLLTTALVVRLRPGVATAAAALLMAAYAVFNGYVLFDWGNLIVGAAGPMVAIGVAWSGGTLASLIGEARERARITRRFGNYVDPELVDFVLESDEDVLAPAEREMTVIFTDLEGFTTLSERLGPAIIPLLNRFMGLASVVIKDRRGVINKFLGDGIMFFYNAPRPNADHAGNAIDTALALETMVQAFNLELAEKGLPKLALRVGITTGPMVVGDAGDGERSDYTVLGDNVNLAARLESANKATGTKNLLTERTVHLLGGAHNGAFLLRPVGKVVVVGQQKPEMTYEALGRAADATEEQRRLAAMSTTIVNHCLEGRPTECLAAVEVLEAERGKSKFTRMYREKCEQFLAAPLGGTFDGQIVLTAK